MTETYIIHGDGMNRPLFEIIKEAVKKSTLPEGVVICTSSGLDEALNGNNSSGLVVVTSNMGRAVEFYKKGATKVVPMISNSNKLTELFNK